MEKEVNLILKLRTLSAIVVSLALQVMCFSIYAGVMMLDIWRPLAGFYYFLSTFFSLRSWFGFFIIFIIMVGIGYFSINLHSVRRRLLPKSRFDKIKNSLQPRVLMLFFLNSILAMTIPITYLYLTGNYLRKPCLDRKELQCLDISNIYIISCVSWTGLYIIWMKRFGLTTLLRFPIIRQHAFVILRENLSPIVKRSLPCTAPIVFCFLPIFFALYSPILWVFKALLSPHVDNDERWVPLLVHLHAWILSAVVCGTLQLLKIAIESYLTQHLTLETSQLLKMLENAQTSMEEELALQDLAHLCVKSNDRLALTEMFQLSHPGAIPYNWNIIFRKCLQVITAFQKEVESVGNPQIVKKEESTVIQSDIRESLTNRSLRVRNLRLPPSPPPQYINHNHHHDALYPGQYSSPPKPVSPGKPEKGLYQQQNGLLHRLMNCILQQEPISVQQPAEISARIVPLEYLFGYVADIHSTAILEEGQKVVWAVAALSGLASRALTEDKFGVVVDDLPTVFTTIQKLHDLIINFKSKMKKSSGRAKELQAAIQDASTRGLITLHETYRNHLEDLGLRPLSTFKTHLR